MANEKRYESFSGVDITPVFQGQPIGAIQAVSYSINREKAPIYTMGRVSPRAFARGKRGIAGSLIFIVFDSHALIDALGNTSLFSADTSETGIAPKDRATKAHETMRQTGVDSGQDSQVAMAPWYSDQIPPFDIVLSAANEYGAQASMNIYGVELLNENSGVSIDDIVTEQQYTYIARDITFWTRSNTDFQNTLGHSKTAIVG